MRFAEEEFEQQQHSILFEMQKQFKINSKHQRQKHLKTGLF